METFLSVIAQNLYELPPAETLVIVPTRRAASTLRILIAKKIARPSRLPVIIAVRDLLDQLSPDPIASDEVLLLELYKVYEEAQPGEKFSQFLTWGEQLLKDFNEIDLHAADAAQLFRQISDLREIDIRFGQDEEDLEQLKSFWKQFTDTDLSPLRKEFLDYWQMLPALYESFKMHLQQKQISSEGIAWRTISTGEDIPEYFNAFKNIIYAGFYAFTNTEELLIKKLQKSFKVTLYKDADEWYSVPRYREAGMFFRKGLLNDDNVSFTGKYLEEIPHHFSMIATGGKHAMARELAGRLRAYLEQHPAGSTDVVVVLPDESLLFSFLNYCRAFDIPVNPSMGFPLTQHPVWQTLELIRLIRVQVNRDEPADARHYAGLLLTNSFLRRCLSANEIRTLEKHAEGERVELPPILTTLIDSSVKDEYLILEKLLRKLSAADEEDEYSGLIHVLSNEAREISVILNRYTGVLTAENWWKMLTAHLQKVRIPFASDNEKGVHVMGFLETRVLDFDAVFVASMNEGVLPSVQPSRSLIPYPVRKYYGMPCREEQEAVTAYHFYRLLQRSPNVTFLYDSNPDQLGGGEMSRYLLQIRHELLPGSKHTVRYEQVTVKPESTSSRLISLKKDALVLEALKNKYLGDPSIRKPFSASALLTYISCPLKFYFEQIAGVRAPEDLVQTLEANRFGEALHKAMELLYEVGTTYTSDSLEQLLPLTDEKVDAAIKETFRAGQLKGIDVLMSGVLKKLARQVVLNDIEHAPFTVRGLEGVLEVSFDIPQHGEVTLKGYLDRVDESDGVIRVIDYKTGKEAVKWPKDPAYIFSNPEYKVTFQLLVYLLLMEPVAGNHPVRAGAYHLSSSSEITFLDEKHPDPLTGSGFRDRLQDLIATIFDPQVPFTQTVDIKNCKFCDFAGLCQRAD